MTRIGNLIYRLKPILQPNLETEITEDIGKRYQFSPNEALNIFRICQEAVANAVRHSEARKIWMNIHSELAKISSFIIEDNGKGFVRQTIIAMAITAWRI